MSATGTGEDLHHPQVLNPEDVDLSGLRAHCREMHHADNIRGGRAGHGPMPRSNRALAVWHWAQHWRRHLGHIHRGLWTLVRHPSAGTTGQTPRPLGWWTGQEAVTREQLNAEFRARRAAEKETRS